MCRLGAIDTTFCPRTRAQRAFCEAEILARAAALILRGPCDTRVLFIPLSALIAVSRAFTCCAALSRSTVNSQIMSMYSSPGHDCCKIELCGSLHQLEEYAQCLVKLATFRCAEANKTDSLRQISKGWSRLIL